MGSPCTRITVSGPLDKMPFDTSIFVQVQVAGRRATFSPNRGLHGQSHENRRSDRPVGLAHAVGRDRFRRREAYFGTVIEVDAKRRTLKVISTDGVMLEVLADGKAAEHLDKIPVNSLIDSWSR